MFKNSGGKIQMLANIVFILGLIGTGAGFLSLLIIGIEDDIDLYIGMAFVVLIFGAIGSYIVGLLIAGYGELVSNSGAIKESVATIENLSMKESKEYEREKEITFSSLDGMYINSDKNKIKIKAGLFEHILNGKQFMFGTVKIDASGDIILTSKDNKQKLLLKQTDEGLVTAKGTKFIKEE